MTHAVYSQTTLNAIQYYIIIHSIHRFKSSDWLKDGHMTWAIFDNVNVWKLIHECYFLLFVQEAVTVAELGTR